MEAVPLSQQELANKQSPENSDQLPGEMNKSQEKYNQSSLLDQFGDFSDLLANQDRSQIIAGRRIQILPGGDAILECINVRGVTFASWELNTTTSILIDAVLMQYGLVLFFSPVNITRIDAGFVVPPSPRANGTVPPLQARQADKVTMSGSASGAGTKDG